MGVPYKEVVDAAGKPVLDAAGKVEMEDWKTGQPIVGNWRDQGTPLGLGNDPKHVFTVITQDGEPVLHITGEVFGGLTTLSSYSNYHFRCQFRWGQLKWPPKLTVARDNGILFDCVGPHGKFWNVWKRSLEFQVEENGMGDLYCLGGTGADITVIHDAKSTNPQAGLSFDPAGTLTTVKAKVSRLKGQFESPTGEWNTLELYSLGQTAVEVVNGHVVQVLRNTVAYPSGNQPAVPRRRPNPTPIRRRRSRIPPRGNPSHLRPAPRNKPSHRPECAGKVRRKVADDSRIGFRSNLRPL